MRNNALTHNPLKSLLNHHPACTCSDSALAGLSQPCEHCEFTELYEDLPQGVNHCLPSQYDLFQSQLTIRRNNDPEEDRYLGFSNEF